MAESGIKIRNIDQLRAQYARGDNINELAVQYQCCRQTVIRHCQDIERPKPRPKLTGAHISSLLQKWPTVRVSP